MAELDPLDLTTRKERIVVAAAALGSLAFHLLVFFGSYVSLWQEPREEAKLMIVRRIPEERAPEAVREQAPARRRVQEREEAVVDRGERPEPEEQTEQPPDRRESREPSPPQEEALEQDKEGNTVSVYTDLGQAFFRLEGPVSHKGAGMFWEKKGMPAGAYTITFGTVEGYETPEPHDGELVEGGSLVFVGRYTRMTQVSVEVVPPEARFAIVRPDGRHLDLKGNRQGLFKDLPTGDYTVVFSDLPGYATPSPQTKRLEAGGHLFFSGIYSSLATARAEEPEERKVARTAPRAAVLDRRIKMVVKSYPETSIEEQHGLVSYPELVIRKSDYQEGWCQVYVIVVTDGSGRVQNLSVERPRADELKRFAPLVEVVEKAVKSWDFERREAEIHVDVRFFVER